MKSNKKVLYLITKSNWGGAQKYVYDLAVAAKERGYEVAVACGGTGKPGATTGRLVAELEKASIPTHPVQNFMRDMSLWRDLKAFFEVWRLLRRERPDVFHVTSSKAGGVGALAGRLAGVPRIIFTSHGLTMDEVWRPKWQRTLIYLFTWLTLRLAHHSIMINTETFDRTRTMPSIKNRVSLVKNGIAPIDFIERKAARAKLAPQIQSRALWIGGIAELHPNKNWAASITALSTLPLHIHLVIIGEGEERKKLEQLIVQQKLQERVHLVGFVADGAQYFNAFDVFLLPSLKEGLPYVLLEAGLAGLPVIASDLPGNRDIITSGETGLLVEPTQELLATSLAMLIRDESMRRRYGAALQEVIVSQFSAKNMANRTFATYESSNSRA